MERSCGWGEGTYGKLVVDLGEGIASNATRDRELVVGLLCQDGSGALGWASWSGEGRDSEGEKEGDSREVHFDGEKLQMNVADRGL